MLKIALAQINCQVGAIEANASKIIEWSHKAMDKGADLVLFPELSLYGYPPTDSLEQSDSWIRIERALTGIVEKAPKKGVLIFGAPLRASLETSGKPLTNSAIVIQDGKLLSPYHKQLLPDYDIFDDPRYFREGKESRVIEVGGKRAALSVCEDIWYGAEGKENYEVDPIAKLKESGAEILINLSASPFWLGKIRERKLVAEKVLQDSGAKFLVYCNLVGAQDEVIFDGSSFIYEVGVGFRARAQFVREELIIYQLGNPSETWESHTDIEELELALRFGISDYFKKTGFKKALIGLSGGIDSAVVACLAVGALGPENVLGVTMPSPYSSEGSIRDSEELAKKLGISFKTIEISNAYRLFQKELRVFFLEEELSGVTDQNVQARIRGLLLMGISNQTGRLLLATGNKSELAMGYSTLYGDLCGALLPIGDLFKTEVYALARFLNANQERIPEIILKKEPSAELAPGQKDSDQLPDYEILDPILKELIESKHGVLETEGLAVHFDLVRDISRRLKVSEYKRVQAPPILKVKKKSFGIGRFRMISAL